MRYQHEEAVSRRSHVLSKNRGTYRLDELASLHYSQPFETCRSCVPPYMMSAGFADRKYGRHERIEGHVLYRCRTSCQRRPKRVKTRSGNTYGFHINTLLQLEHHTVDAPLQECPSAINHCQLRSSCRNQDPNSQHTCERHSTETYVSSRSSL